MKVGIDAHSIGTGAGGNETYMRALLRALRDHAPDTDIVAYVDKAAEKDPEAIAGVATHRLGTQSSNIRATFGLPWAAWRTGVDLLHVQYTAPLFCPRRYVVSIHDIVWRRHPELLEPKTRRRLEYLTPRTLSGARRVFALTETLRQQIVEEYGVPLDKIDVVAPAVDIEFVSADAEMGRAFAEAHNLPEHYILYAGALQPRKNLVRLAQAVARLERHGLPHGLVVAGPRIWLYEEEQRQLDDLNLGDRLRYTGYVPRQELPALIAAAGAFAYVSIYEGFGLPVLEAMACGTPVLTSTDAALQEVVGDAALCCDPLDVDAIEAGLVRVLTDDALRDRLRTDGPARAAEFTHEAMAHAAIAGYRAALA
ncbi:MAG: glycosyltransferase family 4 protein [bacterium]|nr:glycosyltransferase family 4 protein [bacterium]